MIKSFDLEHNLDFIKSGTSPGCAKNARKYPAYRRHYFSRCVQVVAPILKESIKNWIKIDNYWSCVTCHQHIFFICERHFGNKQSTRRYSPLCGLTSSSCEGLWSLVEAFLLLPILGNFWCSVVTSVTFSSKP